MREYTETLIYFVAMKYFTLYFNMSKKEKIRGVRSLWTQAPKHGDD